MKAYQPEFPYFSDTSERHLITVMIDYEELILDRNNGYFVKWKSKLGIVSQAYFILPNKIHINLKTYESSYKTDGKDKILIEFDSSTLSLDCYIGGYSFNEFLNDIKDYIRIQDDEIENDAIEWANNNFIEYYEFNKMLLGK